MKNTQISVTVSQELLLWLISEAKKKDRSISAIVRKMIEEKRRDENV